MADIKNLAEKRARLLTEASDLVSSTAEKGEALVGEAQARFEALTNEAMSLAAAIKSERDAAEARSAADSVRAEYAAAVAPSTSVETDDASELRRIAREGGERNFEYRDVTKSTGLGNPVSVAAQVNIVAGQVNPFLDPAVVEIIRASTGNQVLLPRVTALGTAGSVGEGSQINESDGTLSNLALTPVKYATLLQISNELINDAAFDISSFVAEKAGQEVGIAHGAFAGTAVAAQAGTGVTGATTVYAPTYANLVDLIYSVKQQYRRAPKRGFLANDSTIGGIIKLLDDQKRPIFIPGDLSKPDSVLGFPVYSAALADTAAGALSVLFGDLGAIKTVLVGGVDIAASNDFAFNYGLVTYRIQVRGATGLIEGTAVKAFKGGAAS